MSAPQAQPFSLDVDALAVSRGGRQLFAGLSFRMRAGAALTLSGANGAGKTSLLLALAGALRPEAGGIVCRDALGATIDREPHLHLLATYNAVKPRLGIAENLRFWRDLLGPTGLPVAAALERVGLGGLDGIEAGHLSTGQQRRLALARLLVSRRPLWLLDEPTAALDAAGERLVAALIDEHCRAGGIAIVATHQALDLPVTPGSPREIRIGGGRAVIEPAAGP